MASDGLSIGYRLWWGIRRVALSVFGPAQLGGANDPILRLERERAEKVRQARRSQGR